MKKTLSMSAWVATGILLTGLNATAANFITSMTYSGHTYELWANQDITWADAKANAESGGGYLAALTDAAETSAVYSSFIGNDFFTSNDGQEHQAWLGGYTTDANFTTTNPLAWAWTTGESWTAFDVSNFAGGEPNGDSTGLSINRFGTPLWNDEGGRVGGYIVEKNSVPDSSSTLSLMFGVGSVIVLVGRKYRK